MILDGEMHAKLIVTPMHMDNGLALIFLAMHNQLPDVVSSRIGCCIMLYWTIEEALVLEPNDVLAELLEIQKMPFSNLDTNSLLFTMKLSFHAYTLLPIIYIKTPSKLFCT